MSGSVLENKRQKLETLQTIEYQLSKIIQSHPNLVDNHDSKVLKQTKELSYKLTLLKKHELKRLIDLYEREKLELLELQKQEVHESFGLDKFDTLFNQITKEQDDDEVVVVPLIDKFKRKKGLLVSEFVENDLQNFNDLFTNEESFGMYLDLLSFYELWINLNVTDVDQLSYVRYLEIFDLFDKQNLPETKKSHEYLIDLNDYLLRFIKKSNPLFDLDKYLRSLETNYDNTQDFYCETCDKSFSKDTVFKAHKESKKHLQRVSKIDPLQLKRSPAYLKYQIHSIVSTILPEVKLNTKLNIERKKALTERERIVELDHLTSLENESINNYTSDEEDNNEENNNDDDSNGVFNPLNLPLGLDGQPIPFWLWKLHGLGKEYPCEVCGNYVYKGRKAFEKHFSEPRHIHGLKCLGVTNKNTQVFKDITKINEVLKIWENLNKNEKQIEKEKENAIEVEDEEGNVMSEKVYNDLKKQGLI